MFERVILTRIEPLLEQVLPNEQAGFRSVEDQVLAVTEHIEDVFEANKKYGALMIDLSSAYNMVWHHGLLLKLYNALQDRCMVQVINEIIPTTVVGY